VKKLRKTFPSKLPVFKTFCQSDKRDFFELFFPSENDIVSLMMPLTLMMSASPNVFWANTASLRNEVKQHHICKANASLKYIAFCDMIYSINWKLTRRFYL